MTTKERFWAVLGITMIVVGIMNLILDGGSKATGAAIIVAGAIVFARARDDRSEPGPKND
jgi:hypothetical protein